MDRSQAIDAANPRSTAWCERVHTSAAAARAKISAFPLRRNGLSGGRQIMTHGNLAAIPMAAPTFPSTAWREIVGPDEQTLFEGFAREIVARQKESAPMPDQPLRGFHAKLHAGLAAEFRILDNLPDYARYGVFSAPRTFPAMVRFSNGEPTAHRDTHHEPRGIAIKLIGVPGRKLLPGRENAITQDFLATSHSVTSAVRNVGQFMDFVRAFGGGFKPGMFYRAVGKREAWRIVKALIRTVILSRVRSMATEQFSSTAPIKLGPYAVKFTVRPAADTAATKRRWWLTKNFLRDELADRLRKSDLELDFLVQFYRDDTSTPIEDTSVAWNTPMLEVAQLRIPSCDLDNPQTNALSEAVNRLSFSPWHATEDHRPLGNIMRARRVVYEASSVLRKHSPEPTGAPFTGA
jgi:hypothetical protein